MKQSLVTEAWSYPPNSGTERIEYDLLNICFQAVGDCLIRSGTQTTELSGASLSLKVSGAAHLVTVGQRSLKGVSVDIPAKWIGRFDLPVYVTRSFRAFTGMTIGEFTRAQRLERTRLLLTDASLSLAQIAQLPASLIKAVSPDFSGAV
jgi:hypothetical protein